MSPETKKELSLKAIRVREGILTGTYNAKSGHPGGSMSAADMLTYLYTKEMRINPAEPKMASRDRFVLSKGHAAPALYSTLANTGFFPLEWMEKLRHIGSPLQGHPNMNTVPGVDMSTGSLGQGISAAVGMAKGAKYTKKDINVYTILGDGEMAEGQVWEAMMAAAHYKLDNFCAIVDVNGLQIDGPTNEVMNTAPLDAKLEAFGAVVVKIDGHDFEAIEKAFEMFHANMGSGKPFAIVMSTTKGKGISYMEGQVGWHGKAPNQEEYEKGMAELADARKAIEEA